MTAKNPISLEILNQHLVALGKTGSGKSSALRTLVEMLLDMKKRVCIIDIKGDWYGLKLGADGKSAGYPLVAFGNFKNPQATDIPIAENHGIEIAKLIMSGNRPCIIGFRGWMPSKVHKFWIDFISTIYNGNQSPLWLVIDEVHNYTPKGKVLSPEIGNSIYWTNKIATEGRGIGLRLIAASQRPAKVHNDFLANCETLIAMRVTLPADKDAFHDWMQEYSDDNARGKLVLDEVSRMKTGEAFIWSPEAEIFERLKFPFFKTFDSFASPKEGKQTELKGWAEVDLDEVKEKLPKITEEVKANDPNELKKRIRILEQEKRNIPLHIDENALKQAFENGKSESKKYILDLERMINRIQMTLRTLLENDTKLLTSIIDYKPQISSFKNIPMESSFPKKVEPIKYKSVGDGESLDIRIINIIAMLNVRGIPISREAIARWMGIHPSGGRYLTNLAVLRATGYLEGWQLTSLGKETASIIETGFDNAKNALKEENKRKLLETIRDVGPVSREELAGQLGLHPSGGRFLTNLAWLRTMGIITERGPIQLTQGCLR